MPGKKDTITKSKLKKQKRLLNATMKTLFTRFKTHHPKVKISYSLFCSLKPFWIVPPKVEKRDTCLCELCENFSLLIKKMKVLKMIKEADAHEIRKSFTCEQYSEKCLERRCEACSKKEIVFLEFDAEDDCSYERWVKKIFIVQRKGKEKECRRTVKEIVKCKKKDIVAQFKKSYLKFLKHVSNILHQHKSVDFIKKNLGPDDVLIHVDFSENYGCKYGREVKKSRFFYFKY